MTLILTCGGAGCGTTMVRADLVPAATPANHEARQPYAQVREVGRARNLVWLVGAEDLQIAAAVDVSNTSANDLVIDVARANLIFAGAGEGKQVSASAIAVGVGSVPETIHPNQQSLTSLTVPPGKELTFWILFDEVRPEENRDIILQVPVHPTGALAFRLNADPAPHWRWKPRGVTGLSVRMTYHDFRQATEIRSFHPGFVLWHSRGPATIGLGVDGGALYEQSAARSRWARVFNFDLSCALRPPAWSLGMYVAGQITTVDARDPLDVDRAFPGFSVGLESPLGGGQVPVATLRAGYTRTFDNASSSRNAFSFALTGRFWFW